MNLLFLITFFTFAFADTFDVLLYVTEVDDYGLPLKFYKYAYEKCYIRMFDSGIGSVEYIYTNSRIKQNAYYSSTDCSGIPQSTYITFDDQETSFGYKTEILAPVHVAFINDYDDLTCSRKDDMQRLYYGLGCFDGRYNYRIGDCPDGYYDECLLKVEYGEESYCAGNPVYLNTEYVCDQCLAGFWIQCGAKETVMLLLLALFFLLF